MNNQVENFTTIALIDNNDIGHHITYLRYFSQALLKLDYKVMVFSSQPKKIEEWLVGNCQNYTHKFHILPILKDGISMLPRIGAKQPKPLIILEQWIYAASIIREASKKIGSSPDLVFFNWIDGYFSRYLTHHVIDIVFPYNWSGLYFQAERFVFAQNSLQVLTKHLYHCQVTRSRRCHALAVLDHNTAQKLENKIQKPVITFPDIADESPPKSDYIVAQKIKALARGRTIVGLIGTLSKRKGLLTFLEVAQHCASEDFFFVFAGLLDEVSFSYEEVSKIKSISQASLDNCFFYFNVIPEGSCFNALINTVDILFAAYENFSNSSNLLSKAAVFKKPIIVSEGFCMGERVKNFNLGLTIPERNVSKCIEALYYLRNELNIDIHKSKFGFESYKNLHSSGKLQEKLSQIIAPIGNE